MARRKIPDPALDQIADFVFVVLAPRPQVLDYLAVPELEQPRSGRLDLPPRHLLKEVHRLLRPRGSHAVDAPPETSSLDVGMVYPRLDTGLVDGV